MPDHQHVMLTGNNRDADTWKTIVSYKQKTGYWLSVNRPEIEWQKDFYDHVIKSENERSMQVKYILDNPIRKGLADRWEDYPYKGSFGCRLEDILGSII